MASRTDALPSTIEEAVDRLLSSVTDEARMALRSMTDAELMKLHFGLVAHIRSEFGLWGPNEELPAACARQRFAFLEHRADWSCLAIDADGAPSVIVKGGVAEAAVNA